jgi:hypothetical protein
MAGVKKTSEEDVRIELSTRAMLPLPSVKAPLLRVKPVLSRAAVELAGTKTMWPS